MNSAPRGRGTIGRPAPVESREIMSAAINPKGRPYIPAQFRPAAWVANYFGTTVGAKILIALTGLILVGFVVFHMIGNLKVLYGRDAINAYAFFLKHSLGPYLWVARAVLLVAFVAHIALAIRLRMKSLAARPIGYAVFRPVQATVSSRTMLLTGLVILAFTLFHLAHFTFGGVTPATFDVPVTAATPDGPQTIPPGQPVNYLDLREPMADGTDRHDVYNMMIAGFRNPVVSIIYIIAQLFLFAHLAHGFQSTIQTLGLKGRRFVQFWSGFGYAVAFLVAAGNIAIVVAVWAGAVQIAAAGSPM
jgi:succinate dehydrogenase / fumarate reductase cytochrome b subunit